MPQPENLFDVIVVGSGNGGMTAAITARLLGAERVLVNEKSSTFGGLLMTCLPTCSIPTSNRRPG